MVSILIYYLLLVYQLAMLTNLIEELDDASKSIDIVSNCKYWTYHFHCQEEGLGNLVVSDRNLSNAPACRNIWLSF